MRSHGPPMRSEGPPMRSDGPPMRSEGPPMRSEGRPMRSDGPPMRSEGRPMRSEGPPMRSEGRPMRSDGPPMRSEGRRQGEEGEPYIHRPWSSMTPEEKRIRKRDKKVGHAWFEGLHSRLYLQSRWLPQNQHKPEKPGAQGGALPHPQRPLLHAHLAVHPSSSPICTCPPPKNQHVLMNCCKLQETWAHRKQERIVPGKEGLVKQYEAKLAAALSVQVGWSVSQSCG
jgi:hypothetical protein